MVQMLRPVVNHLRICVNILQITKLRGMVKFLVKNRQTDVLAQHIMMKIMLMQMQMVALHVHRATHTIPKITRIMLNNAKSIVRWEHMLPRLVVHVSQLTVDTMPPKPQLPMVKQELNRHCKHVRAQNIVMIITSVLIVRTGTLIILKVAKHLHHNVKFVAVPVIIWQMLVIPVVLRWVTDIMQLQKH